MEEGAKRSVDADVDGEEVNEVWRWAGGRVQELFAEIMMDGDREEEEDDEEEDGEGMDVDEGSGGKDGGGRKVAVVEGKKSVVEPMMQLEELLQFTTTGATRATGATMEVAPGGVVVR